MPTRSSTMALIGGKAKHLCVILLLGGLAVAVGAAAQPVTVENVRFARERAPGMDGHWLETTVELRGGRSIEGGEGRETRYNSRIEVTVHAAHAVGDPAAGRFEFYRSRLEIPALAQNRRAFVYFYLPPEVVERDRIAGEPHAWRVALTVDGQPLPNAPGQYSRNLAEPQTAQSFMRRIAEDAPRNDGIMLPIYLTPFYQREAGRLRDLPSFIRREGSPAPNREADG